ncbi:hypothetical protein [Bacillus sp. FJAT-18017]|uniref:hypothetical protein n=1 Tax=Bacillus sp. FJAT-18017 TaxID=1705566 RepID=UPI0006ADD1A1
MMTKREVFLLLKMITTYYEHFVVDQEKVDNWHRLLKESSFEQCKQRLLAHAAVSPYPPRICDFASKPAAVGRAIPNCNETNYVLFQRERPASAEVAEAHMAKIREILGIERRNS